MEQTSMQPSSHDPASPLPDGDGSSQPDPGWFDLLLNPTQPCSPPHPTGPATEKPGDLISRYQLVEIAGEGGFGIVWRARQIEPVQREVALKVLKPGMDSVAILSRFLAERQTLALMGHPNIASLFDAGSTDNGRPYFVMELVRGLPITTYCDQHQLSIQERLELFLPVCHAIQHAHQKSILHRDLKPSNILITQVDGKPVPKVIDFGIARALATHENSSGSLQPTLLRTRQDALIGTPQYMSPEQASLSSANIDHRSDIYALGVILYELLTGNLPIEPDQAKIPTMEGLLLQIRETEPQRPSIRPLPSTASSQTLAQQRRTTPDELSRHLRGQLDWITLKTLEKEPRLRYASASALAQDLTQYLHHQPVHATPPSSSRRLLKQIRKHPSFLILLALLPLLALAVFVLLPDKTKPSLSANKKNTTYPLHHYPDYPTGKWVAPFPSPDKIPGLIETTDGWILSRYLNVFPRTGSGGELLLQNAGIRARLRFSQHAGSEATQLVLRRGGPGGGHFELRYYRHREPTRPNQFQIHHWDHTTKTSRMLASIEVPEPIHDSPDGFLLEFYAIGQRLHGRLNGFHPITATVPDATYLQPGEVGFAMLKYCHLRDIEILNLDGLSEAEAQTLAGLSSNPAPPPTTSDTFTHNGSRYAVLKQNLSWPEARRRAEELQGKLAVFENESEENAVCAHYQASLASGCWIGGFAEEGSREIRWISGAPVGKLDWSVGHPWWRSNPNTGGAKVEGTLWPAGLVMTSQSIQIQPQNKTLYGCLIEWPLETSAH